MSMILLSATMNNRILMRNKVQRDELELIPCVCKSDRNNTVIINIVLGLIKNS